MFWKTLMKSFVGLLLATTQAASFCNTEVRIERTDGTWCHGLLYKQSYVLTTGSCYTPESQIQITHNNVDINETYTIPFSAKKTGGMPMIEWNGENVRVYQSFNMEFLKLSHDAFFPSTLELATVYHDISSDLELLSWFPIDNKPNRTAVYEINSDICHKKNSAVQDIFNLCGLTNNDGCHHHTGGAVLADQGKVLYAIDPSFACAGKSHSYHRMAPSPPL